jgi:hypothetical protein
MIEAAAISGSGVWFRDGTALIPRTPGDTIEVSADSDIDAILGRAQIGISSLSDQAIFSHVDHATSTNFAFRQLSGGSTSVNSPAGGTITFSQGNVRKALFDAGGDFGVGLPGVGVAARIESLDVSKAQLRLTFDLGTDFTDFTTNDDGHLAIEPSGGRVYVNQYIPSRDDQLHSGSDSDADVLGLSHAVAGTASPHATFYKSRGTHASPDIVEDDDEIGKIIFRAFDGNDWASSCAAILVEIDGAPGVNDVPGRMILQTTADGDSAPTERVRIDSAGVITFSNGGLSYGGISKVSNAVETAIAVMGTAVQVTIFDTDMPSNGTTPAHGTDDVTILVAGDYMIVVSATVNSVAGGGSRFEMTVQKNNGASDVGALHVDRNLAGGGGVAGSASMSGIATLAASDTIEVWIENETGTENYVVEDITLSLIQIGA